MSTPTGSSSSEIAPPSPSQPKRWPLWRGLLLQWGVVVLVAVGLLGYKATDEVLDRDVFRSVGIAAAIIGLAGTVALVIAGLATDPKQAASMVMAGMLVRLFVPLASLVLVAKRWPELEVAGFREQMLMLYLAALVVETYAAIRVTGMPPPRFASK